jgi:hypothetical protein
LPFADQPDPLRARPVEIIELFRERARIEYRILAITEEIPDDGETLQ